MIGESMNAWRGVRIIDTRLLLITLLLVSVSCSGPTPSDEDWSNSKQSLWVTVTSIPSGAGLFGLVADSQGSYLGTTPLTLKFWKAERSRDPVIWMRPESGVSVSEVIEHSISFGPFQYANMPGPESKASSRHLWSQVTNNREMAVFHCVVAMNGYETRIIRDTLRATSPVSDYPNVFTGAKTYSIVLEPAPDAGPPNVVGVRSR
jgi:hypothetical protein